MWGGVDRSGGVRERWREQRRARRRQARVRARLRTGQTLVIFALSFTVLLSLAGLAIDVARAYDLYAKMQRAAEAGAVAGVLYMPTNYNSARVPGDGLSAVARASAEVVKDGLGSVLPVGDPQASACPPVLSSVEIAVCPLASKPTDLKVIITEHLNVVLLSGLGVQPITLQATAQSEYLPPVAIASRQNYFGDQMECTTSTGPVACNPSATTVNGSATTHLQYFMATMNGPADLMESGDPYVYCAEGPSVLSPSGLDPGAPPASNSSPSSTYNGYSTNHPQQTGVSTGTNNWSGISQYCGKPVPGVKPGNADYQPEGYDGPATHPYPTHQGGYNYAVNVSSNITNATLWIFNPYYIPQDNSNAPDHFQDGGSPNYYQGPLQEGLGPTNPYDGSHHDAPLFFFNTTFTLYKVTNVFDRSTDTQVWTQTYKPYDSTASDLAQHGCSTSTVYDPQYAGAGTANTYHNPGSIQKNALGECVAPPACEPVYGANVWSSWCEAMTPDGTQPFLLSSGTAYRLVVEVTGITATALNANGSTDYASGPQDGWGQHAYALKLCNGAPETAVACDNGAGSSATTNTNLTISGWNNADVTFEQQLGSPPADANNPQTSCVTGGITLNYGCMDLGCIPAVYAGRTLTVGVFDPGDGSGDLFIGVVPPAGSGSTVALQYPSYVTTLSGAGYDGDTVVQGHYSSNGYRPFNGLWLDVTIKLSASYAGDCSGATGSASGWFQFVYMSSNGNPGDKLAVQFTLVGSPVHLVPVSVA